MDDDVTASPTSNVVLAARSPIEVYGAWSDARPGGAWKVYTTRGTRPAAGEIPPPSASAAAGLRCEPNPSAQGEPVAIQWSATGEDRRLVIYDAQGRRMRSLAITAGGAMAIWDGRDEAGRPAPAGVYWVRLAREEGRPAATARIVRLH
jgi:hypothetical protein